MPATTRLSYAQSNLLATDVLVAEFPHVIRDVIYHMPQILIMNKAWRRAEECRSILFGPKSGFLASN